MNRSRADGPLAGALALDMIQESLARGYRIPIEIDSNSMAPWAVPGDRVYVKRPVGRLLPGAVVLALGPSGPLTHRVVGRSGGRYLLKGDNVSFFDGWFTRERLIGAAAGVEKDGRYHDLGGTGERVRAFFVSVLSRFGPASWPFCGRPHPKDLTARFFYKVYRLTLGFFYPR